jgi:hypothetical protein
LQATGLEKYLKFWLSSTAYKYLLPHSKKVLFIEGRWPVANPKDIQFFLEIKERPLKYSQLVALCSTRSTRPSDGVKIGTPVGQYIDISSCVEPDLSGGVETKRDGVN